MIPRPHRTLGTIGLLAAGGTTAAGTLALAAGAITAGTVTLLCAIFCATAAVPNFTIATRLRVLDEIATATEERAAQAHATYAQAARIAEDEITISDLADIVDRWALVIETEKIAGATTEDALATALAVTITHDRKNR